MVALGIGEVDEEPDPMLVSHSSRVRRGGAPIEGQIDGRHVQSPGCQQRGDRPECTNADTPQPRTP